MRKLLDRNYKGALIEFLAEHHSIEKPDYIHFDYGPDHAKVFFCFCRWNKYVETSKGRTKNEAEQLSSKKMLSYLQAKQNSEIVGVTLTENVLHTPEHLRGLLSNPIEDERFQVLSLLGNAFLREAMVYYLFLNFPDFAEGTASIIVSEAMSVEQRSLFAVQLLTDDVATAKASNKSLSEQFDAAIGQIVSMGHIQSARELIEYLYRNIINLAVFKLLESKDRRVIGVPLAGFTTDIHNYKNLLQEFAQQHSCELPEYALLETIGSAHEPTFLVRCRLQQYIAKGTANTRKSAEQAAAKIIYAHVMRIDTDELRTVWRTQHVDTLDLNEVEEGHSNILKFKSIIGWTSDTVNDGYLSQALTTPSFNSVENYQRLELLGDALLKRILILAVLKKYPILINKAVVSPLIDDLVSEKTQVRVARWLGVKRFIFSSVPLTGRVIGDVLEAVIAALFLDVMNSGHTIGESRLENCVVKWFGKEIIRVFGIQSSSDQEFPPLTNKLLAEAPAHVGVNKEVKKDIRSVSSAAVFSHQPDQQKQSNTAQHVSYLQAAGGGAIKKKAHSKAKPQLPAKRSVAPLDLASQEQFPKLNSLRK